MREAVAGMDLDELTALAGKFDVFPLLRSRQSAGRPSRRRPRRDEPALFRVRVDLEQAKPPIWRRLDVRSDVRLDAFHQVLQAAYGWTDSHLHRFAIGGSPFDPEAELFLCPFDVEEGEDEGTPAHDVSLDEVLAEPRDVLRYCYDYGDSWDLSVVLESVTPFPPSAPVAVCVDGRRAAPPEDCGGLRTAADLAEILDDPAHFDLNEINQALTDPYIVLSDLGVHPDLIWIVNQLRGTATGDDLVLRLLLLPQDSTTLSPEEKAAALQPFLWFLDRVNDNGLPLTSAGYLKPADVVAVAEVVGGMSQWFGQANRELQTRPVLQFRECLQKLGLVRKNRGRLLLTRAGLAVRGNPEALWHHIASRLPFGKAGSIDRHAELLVLLLSGSTAPKPGAEATDLSKPAIADALNILGWRHTGDIPVSAHEVRWLAEHAITVLRNISSGTAGGGAWYEVSGAAAALARDAILTSRPST